MYPDFVERLRVTLFGITTKIVACPFQLDGLKKQRWESCSTIAESILESYTVPEPITNASMYDAQTF